MVPINILKWQDLFIQVPTLLIETNISNELNVQYFMCFLNMKLHYFPGIKCVKLY